MDLFGESLSLGTAALLILALLLALAFEFVNGFHDTANAVATVIYTHTLKPTTAVVWSGIWNLLGVLFSSGTVAFGVISLLPVELVLNVGSGAGFAMVFSLLLSAIIWNLGTWYLGLPASSSHTLIGAILGVGLANSLLASDHVFGEGVNWAKAQEVFVSLLVSPVVGFVCAALLLLTLKKLVRQPELYRAPVGEKPPPLWIRAILVLTCTGVSFAHGSNDGQKGMGLLMLILIGVVPAVYALNLSTSPAALREIAGNSRIVASEFESGGPEISSADASVELSNYLKPNVAITPRTSVALVVLNRDIAQRLEGRAGVAAIPKPERVRLRSDLYLVDETLGKMTRTGKVSPRSQDIVRNYKNKLSPAIRFIPDWVKFAVAIALGLGTMIGWKRIVVTVGEKIGKEHLTYAQGASAETVAMVTIGAADYYGLPVSTTHILSSGVAGTMAANRSGLQTGTLRNLLLAWVLTLPVCVFLGAALFAAGINVLALLGMK